MEDADTNGSKGCKVRNIGTGMDASSKELCDESVGNLPSKLCLSKST